MAITKEGLKFALKKRGREDLFDDLYNSYQAQEIYEQKLYKPEYASVFEKMGSLHIENPGDFNSAFQEATLGLQDNVSAIDKLKASTSSKGILDFSSFKIPDLIDSRDPYVAALAEGELEDEQDGFIWGSIKRGAVNDLGFLQATGGLVADAVGANQLGEWLKTKAKANWDEAETYAKSESFDDNPLGWAGQLILEQVPGFVMTLGTGAVAKIAGKTILGGAAKKSVKESLEDAVTKQAVAKGLSKEEAKQLATTVASNEAIEELTKVGLRDAFLTKGREKFTKTYADQLKRMGIEGAEDVAKASLKGARRKAIGETVLPAAVTLGVGAGITDGDIIKDMYDAAAKLRAQGVEAADPTLGDLGIAGFIAPALDAFAPISIGKRLGLFGGSSKTLVPEFLKAAAEGKNGTAVLKGLRDTLFKDALTEGTTEMLQGVASEYAKKNFIDKYGDVTEEQRMEMAEFLLRPEAVTRYITEFMGGALIGGVVGGISNTVEGATVVKEAGRTQAAKDVNISPEKEAEFIFDPKNWKDEHTWKALPAAGETTGSSKLTETEEQKQVRADNIAPTQKREAEVRAQRTEAKKKNIPAAVQKIDARISALQDRDDISPEAREAGLEELQQERQKAIELSPVLSVRQRIEKVKKDKDLPASAKKIELAKLNEELTTLQDAAIAEPSTTEETLSEEPDDLDIDMEAPLPGYVEKVDEFADSDDLTQEGIDELLGGSGETQAEATDTEVTLPTRAEIERSETQKVEQDVADKITNEFSKVGEYGEWAAIEREEKRYADAKKLESTLDIRPSQFTPEQVQALEEYDNEHHNGELIQLATQEGKERYKYILPQIMDDVDIYDKVKVSSKIAPKKARGASAITVESQDTPQELEKPQALRAEDLKVVKLKELGDRFAPIKATEGFVNFEGNPIPEKVGESMPPERRTMQSDVLLAKRASLEQALQDPEAGLPGTEAHTKATKLRDEYVNTLDRYGKAMGIYEAMSQAGMGTKGSLQADSLNMMRAAAITHAIKGDVARSSQILGDHLVSKITSKGGPQYSRPAEPDINEGGRMSIDELKSWLSSQTPGFLSGIEIIPTNTAAFTQETGIDSKEAWDGSYFNGKIYLNVDTLTDTNIEKVLFHEGLGHAMAKQALGPVKYKQTMNTIAREVSRLRSSNKDASIGGTLVSDLLNRYREGVREDGSIDPMVQEEIWAKYIEAHAEGKLNDRSSVFMKIYDAIRQWVRNALGLEDTLTDVNREAARLVRKARLNALDITTGEVSSEVRQSRPRPEVDYIQKIAQDRAAWLNRNMETPDKVSVLSELRNAVDSFSKGNKERSEYVVKELLRKAEIKNEFNKLTPRERIRGADFIRQKLLEAKRREDLSDEAVNMAEWLIKQNENAVAELGISIRKAPENSQAAGTYNSAAEIITLFKGSGNDMTASHEILHHFERLMPEDIRDAIRDTYTKELGKLSKTQDPAVKEYIEHVIHGLAGDVKGVENAINMIQSGRVSRDHYQYLNQSEFWAVNAANLVKKRFEAQGSIWSKAYNLLSDLVNRALGAFGLSPQAPIIKGLNSVLSSPDAEISGSMLSKKGSMFSDVQTKPKNTLSEKDLTTTLRIAGITLPRKMLRSKLGSYIPTERQSQDIGPVRRFFQAAQWVAEKHPKLKEMFSYMTETSDIQVDTQAKLYHQSESFFQASKTDASAVEKILIRGDVEGKAYKSAQEAGLTDTQFQIYQDVRSSLDSVKEGMIADAEVSLVKLNEQLEKTPESGARELIAQQVKDTQNAINGLKEIKGYFPRYRAQTGLTISYTKDGKIYAEPVDAKGVQADILARERQQALARQGIEATITQNKGNAYDAMDRVDPSEVNNLVSNLVKDSDGNIPEGLAEMLKSVLYAKGFGKHYIRRTKIKAGREGQPDVEYSEGADVDPETGVVHGYKTEDLGEVLLDYYRNYAKHTARAKTALKIREVFESREADGTTLVFDPQDRNKTGLYKVASQFLKTAHQGMDGYDQTVQKINGLAYHLWIGGRVSSAIWNTTHIHMFGASLLHKELRQSGKQGSLIDLSKKVLGAHMDSFKFMRAFKGKKNGEEVTLAEMGWGPERRAELDAMHKYHNLSESQTMTSQAYEQLAMNDGDWFKRAKTQYKRLAGWMMHTTEVANRMASMLAHYREFGDYDQAKRFVRLLNGSYEKFNLPGWLQGKGPTTAAAQSLLYTFGTHVQNTSEILISMAETGQDKKALAYGLGMAMLIGGLPAKELIEAMGEMMFGKSMDLWLKETYGSSVANAVQSGAIFPMVGVDAGRSLALSPPPIFNAISTIMGRGDEHAVIAPVMGMIKAMKGEQPLYKAMPIKVVQSLWQAIEEGDQIQIGRNKVFTENGKPMQLTPWEQLLTMGGLVPMRKSEASREIWTSSQIERWWNKYKSNVVTTMKNATTPAERMEASKLMREFNEDLRKLKSDGVYRDIIRTRPVSWGDTRRERGVKTVRTVE